MGYSHRVAVDWATIVLFGPERWVWHKTLVPARAYLTERVPPTYSWLYYELGIQAPRAKQLHRRRRTPARVGALQYAIEQAPELQPADAHNRTLRERQERDERIESLVRDWLELPAAPEVTMRYVSAGITLSEVRAMEGRRLSADASLQGELDVLIALRGTNVSRLAPTNP